MGYFVLCSDLHLTSLQPVGRIDSVIDTCIEKLDTILELANSHDDAPVIVAGDFFDRPRDWYLLPAVINTLKRYPSVPVYTVYGQHDMYMRAEENISATSLGILRESGFVTILHPYSLKYEYNDYQFDWLINGCSWFDEVPMPLSKPPGNTKQMLVIHAPIATSPLWKGHVFTNVKKFMQKYQYDVILAGDIHRRFTVYSRDESHVAVNTGPIMRLDANEYNMDLIPAVAIYDDSTGTIEFSEVTNRKGSDVLTREHLIANKEHETMLNEFVSKLTGTKARHGQPMINRVQDWIKKNKQAPKDVVAVLRNVTGLS